MELAFWGGDAHTPGAPMQVPLPGVGGVGQLLGWWVPLRASGQVHGYPAPRYTSLQACPARFPASPP